MNWVCSVQPEGEMITCSLRATLQKAQVSELIKTAQPQGFAAPCFLGADLEP